MKKIILFLACGLIMASCTKVTPEIGVPTPPPISSSARPSVEKTQKSIDKGVSETAKESAVIKDQKQTILNQTVSINDALAQAERIKDKAAAQEAVSEIEAANLINILDDVKKDSLKILKNNEDLQVTNATLVGLLENAQLNNRESLIKVVGKDNEADMLRNQNTDVGKSLTQKNNEVKNLYKDKVKNAKKLGSASVYKHWIIGGVILLVIGGVLTYLFKAGIIFAKAQNPLSK